MAHLECADELAPVISNAHLIPLGGRNRKRGFNQAKGGRDVFYYDIMPFFLELQICMEMEPPVSIRVSPSCCCLLKGSVGFALFHCGLPDSPYLQGAHWIAMKILLKPQHRGCQLVKKAADKHL